MPFTRGFGVPELIIILVIVVIIFGVGRVGEVGGAIGKAIREFRNAQDGEDGLLPQTKETPQPTEEKDKDEAKVDGPSRH